MSPDFFKMSPQEFNEYMKKSYPKMFWEIGLPPNKSLMAFGCSVGKGWRPLLDALASSLQFDTDKNGYPQVWANQVKEKFGGLRFYHTIVPKGKRPSGLKDMLMDFLRFVTIKKVGFINLMYYKHYGTKSRGRYDQLIGEIRGKIIFAESLSYRICEKCGTMKNVDTRGGSWVHSWCNNCEQEYKEGK